MADNNKDDPFGDAIGVFTLIIFGPVIAAVFIGAVLQALSPAIPFLLVGGAAAAIGLGVYKYRTSPATIRREHEAELLQLLARAEAQQQALPRQLAEADLAVALDRRGVRAGVLRPTALLAPAQAIYAEEFLRSLPPMPGVPLEAERVYDIDYDRRTLKKGEDPPYRLRTDSQGWPTSIELEAFKAWLGRYVASTANPEATRTLFVSTYADFVATLIQALPPIEAAPEGGLTVPLIDFLPNGKAAIGQALSMFWQPTVREWHHFSTVREAFARNRLRTSEPLLRERDLAAGKLVEPDKFPGSTREALDAYLAETPLYPLFLADLPFALPLAKRFEGHWIVARQGSGKTNALECLIHSDLAAVAAGRASLLVMDSQGIAPDTLIGRLATLKLFGPGQPLDGKLIYLEPDLAYPLALNIFDIGMAQMGRLSDSQREDIVGSACEVVEFLFTGLLGGELSDNMTMLYRYLVPAMLAIPNADMNTFIELLDTESGRDRSVPPGFQKYRQHFGSLEPEIRSFLETDYLRDLELVKTKASVRRRLRATLADTTFRRMFTQPRNKLNLFTELQSAKVILVNTFPAKGHVEPFGRLILALLMQATRQRLEIDREKRMPTFVYIDECQDYIARDERIAKYIDKCRKQNVGLVFANQRLSNIENPRVLNALAGVSIKFAGVSDADDADLARLLGTTAEHIRHLPRGRFAANVSGVTAQAIDLDFPPSPLERAPRLNPEQFEAMRQVMHEKYGVRYAANREADVPGAIDEPTTLRLSVNAEAPGAGETSGSEDGPGKSWAGREPEAPGASDEGPSPSGAGDDYDPLR